MSSNIGATKRKRLAPHWLFGGLVHISQTVSSKASAAIAERSAGREECRPPVDWHGKAAKNQRRDRAVDHRRTALLRLHECRGYRHRSDRRSCGRYGMDGLVLQCRQVGRRGLRPRIAAHRPSFPTSSTTWFRNTRPSVECLNAIAMGEDHADRRRLCSYDRYACVWRLSGSAGLVGTSGPRTAPISTTPGSRHPCRARPAPPPAARSAPGTASTTHSRGRAGGRTRPTPDRRRARRRCRS